MSKLWIDLPIELAINRGQVDALAKAFANTPDDNEAFARKIKLVEGILQSQDYQNSEVNWFSLRNNEAAAIAFFDVMSIISIQPLVMPDSDEWMAAKQLYLSCCRIFLAGHVPQGETVFISAIQLMRLMQESMNQAYQQSQQPAIAVPQLGRFRR